MDWNIALMKLSFAAPSLRSLTTRRCQTIFPAIRPACSPVTPRPTRVCFQVSQNSISFKHDSVMRIFKRSWCCNVFIVEMCLIWFFSQFWLQKLIWQTRYSTLIIKYKTRTRIARWMWFIYYNTNEAIRCIYSRIYSHHRQELRSFSE